MASSSLLRTAAKIAWRETRASAGKFLFVVLAVAVGVGALTGVRGFSVAFNNLLQREARTLMAGDLSVRVFALPQQEQQRTLDTLAQRGVQRTWLTETITMLSSDTQPEPLLVSVKAINPQEYPFYGTVKMLPAGVTHRQLDATSVAVSDDLLIRLRGNVGDTVRLGGQPFRIMGIVTGEPDRMSGSLNLGLRLMMTREGLERTGLLREGSRASQRFLFRLLPGAPDVMRVKQELVNTFPEGQVLDYRQSHPIITRGLERATRFLSLVSLIALIVGALGVATAMQSHIQQKMDSIAIMKSLGARSSQVVGIYVLQTVLLGLAGGLLGVLFGAGIQALFPVLIRRYFQIPPGLAFDPWSIMQGLLVGLFSTLLLTLPPLLRVRDIRPALVLRRDMEEQAGQRRRWGSPLALASGGLIAVGLLGIAAWLAESWKTGAWFLGGVAGSLLVLTAVAWVLLLALRWVVRRFGVGMPPVLRHGLANLYRPGNQARPVLVALGIGVMFTLTVYLLQTSLLGEFAESAPPGMPNVFLLDITPEARQSLLALVQRQPGVQGTADVVPSVAARLITINNNPVAQLPPGNPNRRFRQTRSVTWSEQKPKGISLSQGRWWSRQQLQQGNAFVSVSEDAAKALSLQPGNTLGMVATGQPFQATVAAVHRSEGFRMGAMSDFIFTPAVLQKMPVIYFGGVRVAPHQVGKLQRAVFERYPTVTVVNVADALAILQEVVDQIALVVRFISAFSILAGVVILAASVAGTRFRRIREVAVLKTLGGTRRRIATIFSIEFLVLGAVAGLIGAVLANGFAAVALDRLFDAEPHIAWWPSVLAVFATALVANLAGWLASARIIGLKPLAVLREE